jgi:uroporphyrinogen III methyltransferase/synthase
MPVKVLNSHEFSYAQNTELTMTHAVGKVYLVGAGPGDPGLITWRGVECLRQADAVLYDYLVNPRILMHARPDAEVVCLGRHGRDRIMPQSEINDRMIELARQGRTVVRLKGGDPTIFGRLAEELDALAAAGIPFEIVPGITAALAAGSYAGLCITQRDEASAVALVTGHEQEDKLASGLDFNALARFPGTLVFYMGVTTARQWTVALMAAGKPADSPAAIVHRCSWPDQTVIATTLGRVADEIVATRMRPPAIVVVGEMAAPAATHDWFSKRPLFGKRVLITRPIDQAEALERRLAELGAMCLWQPAIEIGPPADWAPVDAALARLEEFHWLLFSSANGVRYLLDRLLACGADLRRLADIQLAAIGPGTAEELARYYLKANLVPKEFRAESLAAALVPDARGQRFLLARASRGREVLAEELIAAGGIVEQVVVYSSRDVEQADPEIAAALSAGRIDWITVTSSAIARSLVNLFGDDLHKSKLASISPITSTTLRELGHKPAAEAREYTMEGIAEAIVNAS